MYINQILTIVLSDGNYSRVIQPITIINLTDKINKTRAED